MKAQKIAFFISIVLIINTFASINDPSTDTTANAFYFHDEWVKYYIPSNNPIWIVIPGVLNTSKVAAKYSGTRGFITASHEHIMCSNAIDIALDLFTDNIEPAEIIKNDQFLQQPNISILKKINQKIQNYFLSKIGKHQDHLQVISPQKATPDLKNKPSYFIDLSRANFAQQDDIDMFDARYQACSAQFPCQPKIAIGHSRGAATIFTSLAQKQYVDFACVVLLSCFDSMEHICGSYSPAWITKRGGQASLKWLLTTITAHKINGICPLNMASLFPKNVPILLVTSQKDWVIPMERTANLAHTLAACGHPHVYLLTLKNSSHFGYNCDDEVDKKNLEYVTHAFYKQYGLPHIPKYASAGGQLLAECFIPPTPQLHVE